MKSLPIEIQIESASPTKLILFAQVNVNLSKKERPDQLGFIKTVGSIETWLRGIEGVYFVSALIGGWTGKKYVYESHFRVENKNKETLGQLFKCFNKFTINSNTEMEALMAIKRAPFKLWGTTALLQELVGNSDVTQEDAEKLSKPELVSALEALAESGAPEPDGEETKVGADEAGEGEVIETVDADADDDGDLGFGDDEIGEGEELEIVDEEGGEAVPGVLDKAEDSEIEKPDPEPEPPPEPVVLGEAKLDGLLVKAGLMDDVVKKMTVGDKRTFLAATAEKRNQMKGDIDMASKKTTAKTPAKTAAKKTATTKAPATKAPAKTAAKKGSAPTLNDQLKKKGLWRSGMQFLKSDRKQYLLDADTERKRNIVFKETATLLEGIKAKQSKIAKKNMAKK